MTTNIGFSSYAPAAPGDTRLSGIELVKRDLLNHFNILPGQVIGRPSFGCELRLLVGEPMDQITRTKIENAVKEVIKYDPRSELISMDVSIIEAGRGFSLRCMIKFTEFDLVEWFEVFITSDGVSM